MSEYNPSSEESSPCDWYDSFAFFSPLLRFHVNIVKNKYPTEQFMFKLKHFLFLKIIAIDLWTTKPVLVK